MIILNISTNTDTRHDVGITLHKRGWHWGDGDSLIHKPLETTFEDNPYIALVLEDKTVKRVITAIAEKSPTRAEIITAGHIIIDVCNEDWIIDRHKKDWVF